jgi:hypothetical protein
LAVTKFAKPVITSSRRFSEKRSFYITKQKKVKGNNKRTERTPYLVFKFHAIDRRLMMKSAVEISQAKKREPTFSAG